MPIFTTLARSVATIEAFMSRMACPSQHPPAPQLSMITHPPATVGPPLSPPAPSHRLISASAPAPTGLPLYLISIPPSPSPIPSYALSSMTAPEFTMATSPSPTPSFTAPMPMPPQQHCEDVFYGSVDGIRATTAQLQEAARCLLARRQGQRPHLQAEAPSRPSNLEAAHGEEGECAGECLQGVCGGVAASCGAWPPSAPANARGNLGVGRPWHMGTRPRPVGRPSRTALARYLQARAWCVSRGRRTPTLRQRR
ncbi:translation initiation factor IF-2-like [Zea mays]|jgi:hypothetical protein|uniref:Uncharacterized protein n=1 Tax=Zea mays TaxID=4577 RepID=C0P437_MAIZE|nr:translation initiation factor IF-2-like [Zea mays]ACN27753.1 unknown [Zea mays]|eukprot:XP_023157831.1 uncharacterized protein LOC111591141 [Zea mays]